MYWCSLSWLNWKLHVFVKEFYFVCEIVLQGLKAVLVTQVFGTFLGVGIGICLTSAMSMGYYSMILGYTVYYLANSFKSPLPWTLCKQSWNTDGCFTIQKPPVVNESLRLPLNVSGPGHHLILTNESKTTTNTSISYISSAEEFWQ